MAFLFFLSALMVCSLAQKQVQCDFEMREPAMTNGFVRGHMLYSYDNHKILHTFTTSGTKELFEFNTNGGNTNFDQQFLKTWSETCPCAISPLTNSQPILFSDSTLLSGGPTVWTPRSPTNALQSMELTSSGTPVKATWTNGKVFTYTACSAYNYVATDFTAPIDCTCGKPIDIVLVLDRSSSISIDEFKLEKEFTENLVASFTYSPLAVNLGITNFHSFTWDGPVDLAEGNTPDSVSAGASALQCAPLDQCIVSGLSVPSGSCCGSGTSISAGIVNGADMLAKANGNGFRASAGKVLIVLTDGYHNKILKRDGADFLSGNIVRDVSGKPLGVPYKVGTTTCNEDKTQVACTTALLGDLEYAVQYAKNAVPSVKIFSIGVGPIWSREQLLAIADGVDKNVFGTDSWGALSSLVDDLVSVTCEQSASAPACGGCCGFCSCSGCVLPDGCDSGNFCDNIAKIGTCCTAQPKPAGSCDGTDKCQSYKCNPAAAGGKGACESALLPVKADTECANYECDSATGETVYTDLCPPKCFVAGDCDDKNACTVDTCEIPGEAHTAFCKTVAKDCSGTDLCFTYACDPVMGCTKTLKPVPANTPCAGYVCDPATGLVDYTNLCPGTPECFNDTQCDDGNACTLDVCINPGQVNTSSCQYSDIPCTGTDLCQIYTCNPLVGCTGAPVPQPPNTPCATYTCNAGTGLIDFKDECPPQPPCLVAGDCGDDNLCTVDACTIDPMNNLNNKCEWTPIDLATCADETACTVDTCVPDTGCVHTPLDILILCNDNDACTVDECDPVSLNTSFPCSHTPVVCNETDICHESYCDIDRGCLVVDIICPTTDNCTISGCNVTNDEGCYVDDAGTCGFPIGAVAGIAAGAVAGIVIAAVAGALLVGGGSAYAFTQGAGSGLGATVSNNPIFNPAGESGYSRLHKV